MSLELNLRFSDSTHLVVSLDGQSAGPIAFAARITAKDLEEIRWYLETYAAHYTTDVDDAQARRIESKLPQWGMALFQGSSNDPAAQRLFGLFLGATDQDRLLTISAEDSAILSLPWELLCDPKGVYLFGERSCISIRRGTAGPAGERLASFPAAKSHLHLLFVTSRPTDASFLDPRSEPQVIMDAVEAHARGRIYIEFLRPATFRRFVERLTDKLLPPVDVVHFDGHGAFDAGGSFGDVIPNTGYLLFERDSGLAQFISAEFWYRQIGDCKVPLVILSACQSAAMSHSQEGDEAGEPLGSVAYGLTALGIPAVLAMTHSLLVETAGQLFGEFYRHLADGLGVGAALDNARRHLMRHPEKHEVQRGPERVRLTVHDWFLPALYQVGPDVPLVDASVAFETDEQREIAHGGLPDGAGLSSALPALQEAGFFGRQRELWNIERWFAAGTRRISIMGFGGQGKTYLASEAGRWLCRTGMFERVAFTSYASFQGMDASGYALATLGLALRENLIDSDAAAAALERTPTLVILDNLEDLEPPALEELLGTAKAWSECGQSRVLLTIRAPDFRDGDYLVRGGSAHRSLTLAGLGAVDALNYFEALARLPPAPEIPLPGPDALLELFEAVSFHPLSINLLAMQLKTRRVSELGARLESLLENDADDNNNNLRASLQLSLDKLGAKSRHWLSRLGVFRGGAWEPTLLATTGIQRAAWIELREQLRAAALIEVESLEAEGLVDVPYLRFHPTLAQLLWSLLPRPEQDALNAAHRQQYYELSESLDAGDREHPRQMRTIARREWPNLLCAAQAALEAREEWAGSMAETVVKFLGFLGMHRDAEALAKRARQAADAGSLQWFAARINQGEQLLSIGRAQEGEAVLREALAGPLPGYLRSRALELVGRCFRTMGRPDLAERAYREAMAEADKLNPSDEIKHLRASVQMGLGDALADAGRYAEARSAYEASLGGAKVLHAIRSEGLVSAQLGALALKQRDFPAAARRYGDAISLFEGLGEPAMLAVFQHQLALAFQEMGQTEEAETLYRESARIAEVRGDWTGAANTWTQLGLMNRRAGRFESAEAWYRKACGGYRSSGHGAGLSRALTRIAELLLNQPGRLAEARRLAEEAVAIKQTLDHGAMQIWNTYGILAEVADKENEPARARDYRDRARSAYRNHPESRQELQHYARLVAAVDAGIGGNLAARQAVERELKAMRQAGTSEWVGLARSIERLLSGERDRDALTVNLHPLPSLIVEAILDRTRPSAHLSNPSTST